MSPGVRVEGTLLPDSPLDSFRALGVTAQSLCLEHQLRVHATSLPTVLFDPVNSSAGTADAQLSTPNLEGSWESSAERRTFMKPGVVGETWCEWWVGTL